MTRLDLLLVAMIGVAAFALGASLGPDVAEAWKTPFAPVATYELAERVPYFREALATLERRQAVLRDRIAKEHAAATVARLAGESAAQIAARRRTLSTLYLANAAVTTRQGDARVELAQAERRARNEEAGDRDRRRWHDRLGRALVGFGVAGALIVLLPLLSRVAGMPVAVEAVGVGSLIVLAALLLGDALSWVAAAALGVLTAMFLVGRRTA